MSESNKILIRRVYDELMNGRNLDLAGELYSSDFVAHDQSFPNPTRGPDGIRSLIQQLDQQFPGHVYSVEDVIAEGDQVAVRWKVEGEVPAKFEIHGISFCRIRDGKITDVWQHWDSANLAAQTGIDSKTMI